MYLLSEVKSRLADEHVNHHYLDDGRISLNNDYNVIDLRSSAIHNLPEAQLLTSAATIADVKEACKGVLSYTGTLGDQTSPEPEVYHVEVGQGDISTYLYLYHDSVGNHFVMLSRTTGYDTHTCLIGYKGDRFIFNRIAEKMDIISHSYLDIHEYETDPTEDSTLNPWESVNGRLIMEFEKGNQRPYLLELHRILSGSTQYGYSRPDEELVDYYYEHVNSEAIVAVQQVRHAVTQTIAKLITGETHESLNHNPDENTD